MERNIRIAYLLAFLQNSYFWLGTWVFYYFLYTNYAGIGLIETIMIVARIISEVPTGAFADLFGKKTTLIIAFFLEALGTSIMAFAPHFIWLLVAVGIAGIGSSFYSGSLDALLYESLKEKGDQQRYDKIISRIGTISLAATAICSIVGGFFYTIQPDVPFIANAICYSMGIL